MLLFYSLMWYGDARLLYTRLVRRKYWLYMYMRDFAPSYSTTVNGQLRMSLFSARRLHSCAAAAAACCLDNPLNKLYQNTFSTITHTFELYSWIFLLFGTRNIFYYKFFYYYLLLVRQFSIVLSNFQLFTNPLLRDLKFAKFPRQVYSNFTAIRWII